MNGCRKEGRKEGKKEGGERYRVQLLNISMYLRQSIVSQIQLLQILATREREVEGGQTIAL